jgi:hypothetical protein
MELMKVVREELVDLLLYNLRHVPGINMAHVFLGYATVDSGVEAAFTPFEGQEACIDYVIDMLADGATSVIGPMLSRAHPRMYEMLWELLHALCVSPMTTEATMCRLEVCTVVYRTRWEMQTALLTRMLSSQARAFVECKACGTLRRQVVNLTCPACGEADGTNTVCSAGAVCGHDESRVTLLVPIALPQSFLCACLANMVLREGPPAQSESASADDIACLLHQAAWMLKVRRASLVFNAMCARLAVNGPMT